MQKKLPKLFKPMLKINVAVVMVIVLIFSIINIISIIQTQRRQKSLQTMAINQASQQIEDFIASAEQLGIVIQNNTQLMAYNIYKNVDYPHNIIWEMEMLAPSVNSLTSLGIVYIDSLYPEINDLIYSSMGRYNFENYCSLELNNSLTATDLKHIIRNTESASFVTHLSDTTIGLLYVMPISTQYIFSPGRLVLRLDYATFTRGFKALAGESSDVYVYDNGGNMLMYFGQTYQNDINIARIALQNSEDHSGKAMFKYKTEKYGITIVQTLNLFKYYQPALFAVISLIIIALIVTALCIKFTYALIQNTAQPFVALVQRVLGICGEPNINEPDEIERLSYVFEDLVQQQKHLTLAMESHDKLEKAQYLQSVLGCGDMHEISDEVMHKYDLLLEQWACIGLRVFVFRFDDTMNFIESYPPKRQWSIKSTLRREFGSLCKPLGFGEAVDLPSGQGIVSIAAFKSEADFAISADSIREALCRISGLSISCGISCAAYSVSELRHAFKEASSNCRYRLFHSGSTITPEYVASIRTQRTRLIYKGADDILQAVKNCNYPEISRGVGSFFADITKATSLPSYKLAYFDVLSLLNKLIRDCAEKNQIMLINMLDLLYEHCYESSSVLQKDLYEFCILLADTLFEQRSEHLQAGLLGTVYTYIENNYASPSLTLSSIAEALSFSPSYLTRHFKVKTGISLMQYIDKKRFEKSKLLLTSTTYSVKTIVEQVGYTDEANFSRKFKANEGITPTQYRSIKKL